MRVQNIAEEGIELNNCKYINSETNNGFLKRSQVSQGNLITKITGVGRMAVSSVAPVSFTGNINQHLVVIKTESFSTSKVLATFLNSDIGEKLASRRSTGGTRPALDYTALKSIPIVFKPEIVEVMESAYASKKQREVEAEKLLNSIDDYVLSELGITLPEIEEKKCFVVNSSQIKGKRIDPNPYHPIRINILKKIKNLNCSLLPLNKVVEFRKDIFNENIGDLPYVGLENIESKTGSYCPTAEKKVTFGSALKFVEGDILFPKLRPYLNKVFLASFKGYCSTEFHVLKIKNGLPLYLRTFLRSRLILNQTIYLMTGNTLPRLQTIDIKELLIPILSMNCQEEIASEVRKRMNQAETLKKEAVEILEKAKQQVEQIILGDQ